VEGGGGENGRNSQMGQEKQQILFVASSPSKVSMCLILRMCLNLPQQMRAETHRV